MADIKHSIRIAAPVSKVVPLVAEANGLKQWWAEDVESAGPEVVHLGFFERATVYRLRKQDSTAPDVLWTCETGEEWEGTRLEFVFEELNDETNLLFAHRDWDSETPYFRSCNTSWGALMFRIKSVAEGGKPDPLFTRTGLAY